MLKKSGRLEKMESKHGTFDGRQNGYDYRHEAADMPGNFHRQQLGRGGRLHRKG
jgi:hypothetical protein